MSIIKLKTFRIITQTHFKRWIIKNIKFLLRDKGLTINGAKKILDSKKSLSIDDNANIGVYNAQSENTKNIKDKVNKIYKIIKELKKN